MNFQKPNLRPIFAFAVLLFFSAFLNIHSVSAVSQPQDTDWSTSPVPYWHQTLGHGLTDPIKELIIRVKNPDADDFYGASIYGYLAPDYASGYGIQPIEQYSFSNLGEPTPRGFDGYVTLTTTLPFSLNPNRYYKLSVLGNSFYIGGTSNDSYQNGKAYYANTSYPCNWYFNPETTCTSGADNGIADIFFKFGTTKTLSGTESLVNSISPGGFLADMNDDYIVETDNWGSLSNGISAYNISTGQKIHITENKYIRPNPVISGHKIVWGESENNNTWTQAIFMYDLDLGTSTQIIPAEQGISSLDFDGDYIVWASGSNYVDGNIFLYDLTKPGSPIIVDKDDSDKMQDGVSNPKVSNGKILYTWSWVCGTWCNQGELRLYNIATSEKTIVANYGGWYPVTGYEIDGDNIIIAWKIDLYNGQRINRYKISTKESTPIYSSSSGIYGFGISDNILTWSDHYDIFIYDFATGKTGRAGIEPKASLYPKIFGKTIIWQDYRAITKMEFYRYEIIDNPVYPIPDSVLNAENQFFQTANSSLQTIDDTYEGMMQIAAADFVNDAFQLAISNAINRYLKVNEEAPLRDQGIAKGTITYAHDLVDSQLKIPETIHNAIKNNLSLNGIIFPERIETSHNDFLNQSITISPLANLEVIASDINAKSDVIASVPTDIQNYKANVFDTIQNAKKLGQEIGHYIMWGGMGLIVKGVIFTPTAPVNVPLGLKALAVSNLNVYAQPVADIGEMATLLFKFGDVLENEIKINEIFDRQLQRTVGSLETGQLPETSGIIEQAIAPESVYLDTTGRFSTTFKNTGAVDIDARLRVAVTDPNGETREPFTSETKKIPAQSEADFSVDVPFPGFLGIFGATGTYNSAITMDFGTLSLEKKSTVAKTFEMKRAIDEFFKFGFHGSPLTMGIFAKNNDTMPKKYTVIDIIPNSLTNNLNTIEFLTPPTEIGESDSKVKWTFNLNPGESKTILYRIPSPATEISDDLVLPPAKLITPSGTKDSSMNFMGTNEIARFSKGSAQLLKQALEALPDSAFRNNGDSSANLKHTLINKVDEVITDVNNGDYQDAFDKLTNDIRPKAGGIKGNNNSEKSQPWLVSKEAQERLLGFIDESSAIIKGLASLNEMEK